MAPKAQAENRLLTDTELELMNILWTLGEGNVHQVIERLPVDRPLAYTSVSTILRILEDKAVLQTRKEGRGHIYRPLLSKADYEARSVDHLVQNVFSGTRSSLMKHLLQDQDLTRNEIDEIKALLARWENPK